MRWLEKRRQEIYRQWMMNELTLVEAVQALHKTGIPRTHCWTILENM
jgi:hypothetical protein